MAADFDGRHGVGFDPAAHHVFGDLLEAQQLSQHVLRAERRVAEIGYALGIPLKRKPPLHQTVSCECPYNPSQLSDMPNEHVPYTYVHNTS